MSLGTEDCSVQMKGDPKASPGHEPLQAREPLQADELVCRPQQPEYTLTPLWPDCRGLPRSLEDRPRAHCGKPMLNYVHHSQKGTVREPAPPSICGPQQHGLPLLVHS